MSEKTYYYLKLEQTYFNNKIEKALRKMPSGAEMLICYLKMQLKYISSEGFITYSGIYDSIEEEIGLEIDEDKNIVKITMITLTKWGYIEQSNTGYYLADMQKRVGSKTDVALRVAKHREKQHLLQCNKNVTQYRDREELELDIELKKEIDIDKQTKSNKEYETQKRFIKPTAQEVTDYAKSIDFTLDGEYWIDHYDGNGWMVGKNKMKDWKAVIRTWKNNDFNKQCKPIKKQPTKGELQNQFEYEKMMGTTDIKDFETWKQKC